jgi:hypothetical protein
MKPESSGQDRLQAWLYLAFDQVRKPPRVPLLACPAVLSPTAQIPHCYRLFRFEDSLAR